MNAQSADSAGPKKHQPMFQQNMEMKELPGVLS